MIERNCLNCNSLFYVKFNSERNKFCTLSCSSSYNGRRRKFSDKSRKKMSLAKKGKKLSKEHRKNMSLAHKKEGYVNKGAFKKGQIPWNKYGEGKIRHINLIKKRTKEGRYIGKSRLEKNPNWRGGGSYEDYPFEFNEELKIKIRKRDNFCCIICNKNGYDIHHIDGNKNNNREDNLITICKKHHGKCHGRNNTKREEMEFEIRKKWEDR